MSVGEHYIVHEDTITEKGRDHLPGKVYSMGG